MALQPSNSPRSRASSTSATRRPLPIDAMSLHCSGETHDLVVNRLLEAQFGRQRGHNFCDPRPLRQALLGLFHEGRHIQGFHAVERLGAGAELERALRQAEEGE